MIGSVDSYQLLHSKRYFRTLNRTSVSFLDPSMKNNTAPILKSTRVRTIPFKRNYPCACPINYPIDYSGKHINSPLLWSRMHGASPEFLVETSRDIPRLIVSKVKSM